MKKDLSMMALLMSAVFLLAGCGSTAAKAEDNGRQTSSDIVLTAATQTDYPPFCFIDEKDKLTGFDYELLELIDERLDGYTIDIKGASWDSMFLSLESKKFDLISDEVAITPDREEKYYFSLPYLEIQSCIVVKKGTTGITTLDDLAGKHVVTTVDSYSEILEAYNDSHEDKILIEYVSDVTALEELQGVANGKYDAHINDPVMMTETIKQNNLDLEIINEPVKSDPAAIVFAKTPDGKALKELIDPVMREIIEDGSLAELSRKWTGDDYTPDLKKYE